VGFILRQQQRTDAQPAMRLRDIQRNQVSERRILFTDQKARNLPVFLCDQAFGARLRQVVAQHHFGVRNSRRKTRLVEFIDRAEIVRLVLAYRHTHAADSMVSALPEKTILRRQTRFSAKLSAAAPWRRSHYLSGGACANRNPNTG
jgi:hypothetical protein